MLQLDSGLGIESGSRLVHDEDLGIVQEGPPEAEALGLAFGELIGEAVGEGTEVGELHHFLDAAPALVIFETEGPGVKIEILQHGHVVVIAKMIGHPTDEGAHLVGVMDHIDAADLSGAHGGVVESGENPHGGGFPRTIGSHEPADRAVGDFEGNAVNSLQLAEVTVEILDKNRRHWRLYRQRGRACQFLI